MSVSPKSPRHKVDEAMYRERLEKINDHVVDLIKLFKSLAMLNMKMGAAPKGTIYHIRTANERGEAVDVILRRSDLKMYNTAFAEELKDLKHYFRFAKKKKSPGREVSPSDAKGIYSPVQLSDGLVNFFNGNAARFGSTDPRNPSAPNLIQSLSALPAGLALRNSVSLLIYIYIYANNLQDAKVGSDVNLAANDPFRAFLTTTAPPFAYGKDEMASAKAKKDKFAKIGNSQNFSTAQILASLGVKEIRRKKKGIVSVVERVQFNDSKFRMFFIQSIVALNVYSKKDLQALGSQGAANLQALLNPSNVANMVNDHAIINNARAYYHQQKETAKKLSGGKKKRV